MLFRYKTNLLKPKQIKQLKEHKYSSSGQSILESGMQKLWNKQINYIPKWIAPNVLTLIGLLANIITTLLLMVLSPNAKQDFSGWASILCAIGLFIYQSLDALDGKQARRTNSSSALGELFDHGCDSLSAVSAMLSVCVCTKMGTSPSVMVVMAILTLFVFYTGHWQTYVSGRLLFTTLNVTEAQISVMIVLLISGIAGTRVWDEIPGLKTIILLVTILGSAYISWSYIVIVFTGGAGKNKSTIADTSVLSPIFPFGLMAFAAVAIFNKSQYQMTLMHPPPPITRVGGGVTHDNKHHGWHNHFEFSHPDNTLGVGPTAESYFSQNICLYVLLFGLVMSKLTDNLVIAHMTKSELPMVDSIFLGPGILALNQYYNHVLPEKYVFWVAFAYTLFDLCHYLSTICLEISTALKIPIFTLPKLPNSSPGSGGGGPPSSSSTSNGGLFSAPGVNGFGKSTKSKFQ